jgi:hypothetical protein
VLRCWIGKDGVPRALYTDWKNVYKRQPSERERLEIRITPLGICAASCT